MAILTETAWLACYSLEYYLQLPVGRNAQG
jgi:hypothetical protein